MIGRVKSGRHATALVATLLSLLIWLPGLSPIERSKTTEPREAIHSLSRRTANSQAASHAGNPLSNIPVSFEPGFESDRDSIGSRRVFVSRFGGNEILLRPNEVVITPPLADDNFANINASATPHKAGAFVTALSRSSREYPNRPALKMKFAGGAAEPKIEGVDLLSSKSNYFAGADRKHWRTNVPNFAKVRYRDVYAGIDVVFHGSHRRIEYDFIVAPGADPGRIKVAFEGADEIAIDETGELVLTASGREIRQPRPLVYQELGAVKRTVPARYVVDRSGEIGFELGDYDPAAPLIIDPVLSYSTVAGENGASGSAVAVDSSGCVYVTGWANVFPTTDGAFQTGPHSGPFVAKLNPEGTSLIYSTFLTGSSGVDSAESIAVDSEGAVYVAGESYSFDFPLTPGSAQPSRGGDAVDVFVAKLSADGSQLLYSTLLGGSGVDVPTGLAIDHGANAYVVGFTTSADFPTTADALQSGPGSDRYTPFVTKLNAEGTAFAYSTFLTGEGEGFAYGVAVNSAGNAYVTGYTTAADFPVTAGAFQTRHGGAYDAFVAELNPSGGGLVYSTFIGGKGFEEGYAIALDSSGSAYVAGETNSSDFPTTSGALQRSYNGGPANNGLAGDGFVAKLNPAGSALLYSTYLGGASDEEISGIAIDSSGSAYVTGSTSSTDFPVVNPFQRFNGGGPSFKSTDGGVTWNAVRTGLTSANVTCFMTTSDASTIYAGTVDGGLFKSVDRGATWSRTGLPGEQIFAVAADKDNATLYAACSAGVRASTDGGRRWSAPAPETYAGRALAVDPINSGTVYAAAGFNAQSLLKSTDFGVSWRTIGPADVRGISLALDPRNPSTLFAGGVGGLLADGGVAKSTDGGGSWNLTGLTDARVTAIAVDPHDAATIFAGDSDGFVYRSTDGGASWIDRNLDGHGAGAIRSLAVDPNDGFQVFAGGARGLFKSHDGGRFWSKSSDGLLSPFVNAIAVDPKRSGNVYVGTGKSPEDAFLAKLSPDGSALLFSTYLGGASEERGSSVVVDLLGRVYLTGSTDSINFATTQSGFPTDRSSDSGAFIIKIGVPRIISASLNDKVLTVVGESFDEGAVVLINGQEQKTKSDSQNPATTLTVKKAAKAMAGGRSVLRVRNSDGSLSVEFPFTAT